MGRGKVPIQYIEETSKRQVTFSKRRKGLIKKARELAILCECEVALMIFSNTNKMYEFRSSDRTMDSFLTMYRNSNAAASTSKSANDASDKNLVENDPDANVATLREALIGLRCSHNQMLGIGLEDLDYKELHNLEKKLTEGFCIVRNRKELLYIEEMRLSKQHEEEMKKENEALRKEVEELRQCLKSSGSGSESSSLKRNPTDAGVMTDQGYITEKEFESDDILSLG